MRTPRHQLIASMGLGKSGAILARAAAVEYQTGRWPGLCVFAPLQVALSWRHEIAAWRPDLKVILVAGKRSAREDALKASADVYLISYDSTPWMHDFHPASWSAFGSMAVCDESTRVKHTRAVFMTSSTGKRFLRTSGGIQTNALATHAADFTYWMNATGTPSPNGLTELWGQYWYIDGGYRLGNSYTDFERRWFVGSRYNEFAKPTPLRGAAQEIAERVADVTTVVKVEDYLSVTEHNIVDRFVDLDAKTMRQYQDMRLRMRAQIQQEKAEKTLTVQTAAAKVAKLLQIASGCVYHRDEEEDPDLQQCEELHTAKLDVVESILEETNEPLVVVYYFQFTLDQLKKRFKDRVRELDKNGVAQEDWNAGKVEILALQYRRGSMGLSLQHGGRNICLLTPTYRSDDYYQVLERLGPLRQMQSGYNRTVNVFRLIARGTIDSDVLKIVEEKQANESAVVRLIQAV